MAVFESGYKEGLSRADAVALVASAIRSGIYNDLGSGSNVDLCVITKGKVRVGGCAARARVRACAVRACAVRACAASAMPWH